MRWLLVGVAYFSLLLRKLRLALSGSSLAGPFVFVDLICLGSISMDGYSLIARSLK